MRKIVALAVALAILLGAQYMAWRQRSTISVETIRLAGNPAEHFRPANGTGRVVVIAHGIMGSKAMMRTWGYYFARQGYDTYLYDQPGHGENTSVLSDWQANGSAALGENLRAIVDELLEQGKARPGQIALVGHAMGGAAVTAAALADTRIGATVAISSTYTDPTPANQPGNLLSLVAERDPKGVVEAAEVLAKQADNGRGEVGTKYGSFVLGNARKVVLVPGRNQITILYDSQVMAQAADWVAGGLRVLDSQPVASGEPWLWVVLALAGALGVVLAVGAILAPSGRMHTYADQGRTGVLMGSVTLAVAALSAVLATVYLRVSWPHLLLFDYLLPYFLVMAAVLYALRLIWPRDFGFALSSEPWHMAFGRGFALFLFYVGAVGTIVQMNLMHYRVGLGRALPLLVLAVVLWCYFVQEEGLKYAVVRRLGHGAGLAVGLIGRLVILATWFGAAALPNPQPLLPLMAPVILGLMVVLELVALVLRRWRYPAVSIATFLALVMALTLTAMAPLV